MKKASAYSPTEECWLETLYSHGATASLKVDGVKYKKKKKAQDPFWRFVLIQSNFSRNYYMFVILACCIIRMQMNQ